MLRTNQIISFVLVTAMLLSMITMGYAAETTALTLDVPAEVVISQGGEEAYFTFTPEIDGVYMFSSTSDEDTIGYLYDENMNLLTYDDVGGDELNLLVCYGLTAGKTYTLAARYLNSETTGSFTVTLTISPVAKLEVEPLTILEGTCGDLHNIWEYHEIVGSYYYYYWENSLRYTITFTDGTVVEATGWSFQYNDMQYYLKSSCDQNPDNPWTAGNTYTAQASVLGVTADVSVTIEASPVESVVFEPVSVVEKDDGWWREDYNSETDSDGCEWFFYDWCNNLRYTITFTDGTTVQGHGYSFWYNGQEYSINYADTQSCETPWEVGNTYTAQASVLGVIADVSVTITASPVESITFEPLIVTEGLDGEWRTEYNSETGRYDCIWYWYEDWQNNLRYTVTFTDGTTQQGTGTGFQYNGQHVEITYTDTQSHETPWEAGNTYTAQASVLGVTADVSVTIEASPVESVVFEPVSVVEKDDGWWREDYNSETDSDGCEWFFYDWYNNLRYTITFTDGTTVQGHGYFFWYNGQKYSINYADTQSYETPWEGGNSYDVTVMVMDVSTNLSVSVEKSLIKDIVFEPLTVMEGFSGFMMHDWNPETQEEVEYYYYSWTDKLAYTVIFTDGTTLRNIGPNLYYNDRYYDLDFTDTQSYETPWEGGNSYDVSATYAGVSYDTTVTVEPSFVADIVFHPTTLTEGLDGSWDSDWDSETQEEVEYYHYWWRDKVTFTVTFTDGTTLDGTGTSFEHNGRYYEFEYDDNQSAAMPWKSGNDYDGIAYVMGQKKAVPITIAASPVTDIVVKPITLVEGTCGSIIYVWNDQTQDCDWEYFDYEWENALEYTITFDDGTVLQGKGASFEYNGETYWFKCDDSQSYENQWQVGNTYTATLSAMNFCTNVSVSIEATPIVSIVFNPIYMEEGIHGGWNNAWNPETEQYDLMYYSYFWSEMLVYTITFADGTVVQGRGRSYEYNGEEYWLDLYDDQSYENQWQSGNTYTVTADTLGVETQIEVTITPSSIQSIVFEPVSVIENFSGFINTDWNEMTGSESEEYFYYTWSDELRGTVIFTDGTTQKITGDYFSCNDTYCYIFCSASQNADSRWEVGGTYAGTVFAAGKRYDVDITVVPTPVKSVEVSPIEIIAGSDGYLVNDYIDDSGYSPEYYLYNWEEKLELTITYADGTVRQESGSNYRYNGRWYDVISADSQSYDNQWTQGNTYTGTINILGYQAEVPVTITDSFVADITVEPIFMFEKTNGYWEYSWDSETGEPDEVCFYYNWVDYLDFTITFTDGTTYEGTGSSFEYNGEWYDLDWSDDQYSHTLWDVGTHNATVSAMGVTAPVSITVMESPVQSIVLDPITVQEGVHGEWRYEDDWRWFDYSWAYELTGTVTFKDGTTGRLKDSQIDYQGNQYDIVYLNNQSRGNNWVVGNTYTPTVWVLGTAAEATVNVVGSNVQSVTIDPLILAEYNDGFWNTDYTDEGEVEYFCYDWWDNMTYSITFKDGNTITGIGSEFEYDGEWYYITTFDTQSPNNQFAAGNTYTVSVDVAGYETQLTVQIVTPESENGYEYLILDGKAYITNCTLTDTVLTIPSTLGGYEVAGIRGLNEALNTAQELVIPDSVTEIAYDLYRGYNYILRKITLGSGVKNLSLDLLLWQPNLEQITVSENNASYCSVDGVLYDKAVTTLLVFPRAYDLTHVIPDSVTDISMIFENLYYYTGIAIQTGAGTPEYVTVDEVVYTADMTTILICSGAKTGSYVMPESVTTIQEHTFVDSALTSVTISPNVKELPFAVFCNATNLETVVLHEGLETIGSWAFENCSALEAITIPASVTKLSSGAFAGCESLESVTFLGDAPELSKYVFYGVTTNCYYPGNNSTWTEDVLRNYGGEITWIPYGAEMTAPTLAGKSFSLSFEDEILVNFYYSVSDMSYVTEHGMLVFYTKPETPDCSNANDVYADGDFDPETGLSMAQTHGIAAKYMGDTRYYVAYAKLMDGTVVYSKAYEYSPKKYATNMLGRASTSDKQKALCVAMLNYGAAAQEFFGYNTNALMNADLTEAQKALVAPYDATLFTGAVSADNNKTANFPKTLMGFSQRSASVSFEGAFAINYYFAPSEAMAGDMTFYYWTPADYAAADKLTMDNASGSFDMKRNTDGSYWAQVSGIAAKNLDKTYYVCGMYTDTLGRTFCTGVIAYSLSKYCMNNAMEGKEMQHLAASTAMYGYYAEQYFNT